MAIPKSNIILMSCQCASGILLSSIIMKWQSEMKSKIQRNYQIFLDNSKHLILPQQKMQINNPTAATDCIQTSKSSSWMPPPYFSNNNHSVSSNILLRSSADSFCFLNEAAWLDLVSLEAICESITKCPSWASWVCAFVRENLLMFSRKGHNSFKYYYRFYPSKASI